ncbi:hypothetical protein BK120_23150 [Paenibacillus sp. FSL A5-0031]|uniref:hypothetical protein n=1 Tax=Paenibacillus sp. FSL A5-0031 TaxID=1920420 RepID=UPI00096FC07F|nr:hypothetical protein [Paenibacillus sp. FSL A5-0031]OME78639.1 hypothetical protein BK120_23150 [Paenibacillus sp. FSL A5-0031]
MHLFFDSSVLPVTTTDINGNILYIRTNGLHYYGYPDLIFNQNYEDGEQLILDIIDRIFKLDFNIAAVWNYNGKLFKLEIGSDGLAHIISTEVDETRILSIINPLTGETAKHKTKGFESLFDHPEVEVEGNVLYGREILSYLIDQVKNGEIYDADSSIEFEKNIYSIYIDYDRLGNPVMRIQLDEKSDLWRRNIKKNKILTVNHLERVK